MNFHLDTMSWCFLIVTVIMTLDIVTGVIKSIYNRSFSSEDLRKGLAHKLVYVVIMILAWFIEQAEMHVDLGISWPLVVPVTVALSAIDVISILENAVAVDPELGKGKISSIFTHDLKEEEKDEKSKEESVDNSNSISSKPGDDTDAQHGVR